MTNLGKLLDACVPRGKMAMAWDHSQLTSLLCRLRITDELEPALARLCAGGGALEEVEVEVARHLPWWHHTLVVRKESEGNQEAWLVPRCSVSADRSLVDKSQGYYIFDSLSSSEC